MAVFNEDRLKTIQNKKNQKKKHKILIVDDEEHNLNALTSVLSFNYEVLRASNGIEACEVIEAQDPKEQVSMVISDQRMPQMTGVELFEHLSQVKPDIIRIILTGYTDVKAILSAINQGQIYHFMLKPFQRVEFLMVVKQGIATYELRQQTSAGQQELRQQLQSSVAAFDSKTRQLDEALAQLKAAGLESEALKIASGGDGGDGGDET